MWSGIGGCHPHPSPLPLYTHKGEGACWLVSVSGIPTRMIQVPHASRTSPGLKRDAVPLVGTAGLSLSHVTVSAYEPVYADGAVSAGVAHPDAFPCRQGLERRTVNGYSDVVHMDEVLDVTSRPLWRTALLQQRSTVEMRRREARPHLPSFGKRS